MSAEKNVLSFDCAIKSLAICNATLNLNYCKDIRESKMFAELYKNSFNLIRVHLLEVHDLIPGHKKKGYPVEKYILALKNLIMELDKRLVVKPDIVLIEYQMPPNLASRGISEQLVFHYSDLADVHLVGPSIKNTIHFSRDLRHEIFLEKYINRYTANKAHSKINLKYWATLNKRLDLINKIPKKNLDDAADAFMQILGWFKYRKYFVLEPKNEFN